MKLSTLHWLRAGVLLWVLLGAALTPFLTMAAEPPAKIKLLIIEGVSNHDWKETSARAGAKDSGAGRIVRRGCFDYTFAGG